MLVGDDGQTYFQLLAGNGQRVLRSFLDAALAGVQALAVWT